MDNKYFTEEFVANMTAEEGKFILDHAEKVLKDTVDTHTLIVTRTTTLITIASTITVAMIGFVINRYDVKGKIDKEAVTGLITIAYLMWINWHLVNLVLPKPFFVPGSQPKHFFRNEIFDQHKDNRLKIIYANEIQEYQMRMNENMQKNETKWALYKKSLLRVVFTPIVLIISYAILALLFLLFSDHGC